MSMIDFRFSKSGAELTWDETQDLIGRLLKREGGTEAVEDIERSSRPIVFAESRKPIVYDVVNQWLDEVGSDQLGERLMNFRMQLQRDLGHGLET